MTMKVTTLNLAGYKNWDKRKNNIISYLNDLKPDVVFLQEVKYDTQHSSHIQSKHLNDKLSTPYLYFQSCISRIYQTSEGEDSREGLAVLSKYPIIDSEALVLAKRPDDKHTRIIQKVRLLVNNDIVSFVNVHFSNNQYSSEQLEETLDIVRHSGERSIVLGDFNIFDLRALKHLYSSEYIASTEISTYVSFPSENVTLDYVLVPKEYRLISLSVGENMSDHNALSFDLTMR